MAKHLNIYNSIAAIIILASGLLMFGSAQQESATYDEAGRIAGGYSIVKFQDGRLWWETPLIKTLSAIPLLTIQPNFSRHPTIWSALPNMWLVGGHFFYKLGNDPEIMLTLARMAPIIVTIVLLSGAYWWSKKIIGAGWALLALLLLAFSPTILAHGHYVTNDVPGALGVLITVIAYTHYLKNPNTKNLIFSGLALGVAEISKISNLLLLPYLVLITGIYVYLNDRKNWLRHLLKLGIIFGIAYLLVYLVYFMSILNYSTSDQIKATEFVYRNHQNALIKNGLGFLSHYRITQPIVIYTSEALLVRSIVSSGFETYFLGNVYSGGRWYYFPIIYALKEPIPAITLSIGAAIILALSFLKTAKNGLRKIVSTPLLATKNNFAIAAMLIFIVLYWGMSMYGNLNVGIRHLIPTLPLIYIVAIFLIKQWRPKLGKLKIPALSLLAALQIGSALNAYPFFISYFNFLGNGTMLGYKIAVDSNYDWGQDLKRLRSWIEKLGAEEKVAVNYFGGGNPKLYLKDYLGEKTEYWNIHGPLPEKTTWLAISATTKSTIDGKNLTEATYGKYVTDPNIPDARIGTSIFLYRASGELLN